MRATQGQTKAPAASAQRISDWKAGRNVPARFETLRPVLLTLIDQTRRNGGDYDPALLDLQEWKRLWTASDAWNPAQDIANAGCPYLGLASYRRDNAVLFFGRGRPTAEFAELVRAAIAPGGDGGIIALVGASGAGKSSLLDAGLIPAVGVPADDWAIATLTPGADPLGSIRRAIDIVTADGVDALVAAVREWSGDKRLLLIVDQFEELFTICADEHARGEFLAVLEQLPVVIGIRADFYARCLDYPALESALKYRSYLLGPMRLDELAEAITGPAEAAGAKLEAGLADLVSTELCGIGGHENRQGYDPGALPLVSHVLEATWQRREGGRLTVAGYRQALQGAERERARGRRGLGVRRGDGLRRLVRSAGGGQAVAPRAGHRRPGFARYPTTRSARGTPPPNGRHRRRGGSTRNTLGGATGHSRRRFGLSDPRNRPRRLAEVA